MAYWEYLQIVVCSVDPYFRISCKNETAEILSGRVYNATFEFRENWIGIGLSSVLW